MPGNKKPEDKPEHPDTPKGPPIQSEGGGTGDPPGGGGGGNDD